MDIIVIYTVRYSASTIENNLYNIFSYIAKAKHITVTDSTYTGEIVDGTYMTEFDFTANALYYKYKVTARRLPIYMRMGGQGSDWEFTWLDNDGIENKCTIRIPQQVLANPLTYTVLKETYKALSSNDIPTFGVTLFASGTIPRSETDTPVEITIPSDNWYAIALNCDGIPPFALYIARRTDEIALVRLAVHSAAQSNTYAYASVSNVNGNQKLLIHSTDSGGVDYKIYKLPF